VKTDRRDIIGHESARTEVDDECQCFMSLKLKSLRMTEHISLWETLLGSRDLGNYL